MAVFVHRLNLNRYVKYLQSHTHIDKLAELRVSKASKSLVDDATLIRCCTFRGYIPYPMFLIF